MEQAHIYNDWISHHAKFRGARPALVDDARGITRSYAQLDQRINALASALKSRYHVRPGDRIALVSKSCSEAFEIQFACARLGATFVPINWRLSADELSWILDDCTPAAVFCDTDSMPRLDPQRAAVAIDLQTCTHSAYEALLKDGDLPPPERVSWEAIWMIVYTSGTTGRPKGAMLSYRMVHMNVLCWLSPSRITDQSVFLCAMPTFHTGGLHCYSSAVLYAGGAVVIQKDYDPARAIQLMADPQLQITHFFGTPTHYALLTQCAGYTPGVLKHLQVAGMGGAPSSNAMVQSLLDDGIPLQPAYGMSEIGPAIFVTELEDAARKIGSCGHPTLHVEMKVVDAQGRSCNPGEAGELWVRGPLTMTGYWANESATRASFEDGWFKTGDGVRVDADGYVYVVDRLKDMFISGGENVYPAEVERVLGNHADVLMAAVVGVEDARWGEVGAAYVVLKRGAEATPANLLSFAAIHLAPFKVPKSLKIVADLPRNASGKIVKRALLP